MPRRTIDGLTSREVEILRLVAAASPTVKRLNRWRNRQDSGCSPEVRLREVGVKSLSAAIRRPTEKCLPEIAGVWVLPFRAKSTKVHACNLVEYFETIASLEGSHSKRPPSKPAAQRHTSTSWNSTRLSRHRPGSSTDWQRH
jgi:hypothetical protein